MHVPGRRLCSRLIVFLVGALVLAPLFPARNNNMAIAEERLGRAELNADERELLRLHEAVLAAHRNNDLDSWMKDESDAYVMVNRGEIDHPDKKARRARLGPYLDSTTFHKYADLVEPQVRVAEDGTLGWVIAQVQIVGTRRLPDGSSLDFDDTWAWIELYEKQDGRWRRIGNVSNHKPE